MLSTSGLMRATGSGCEAGFGAGSGRWVSTSLARTRGVRESDRAPAGGSGRRIADGMSCPPWVDVST